MSEILRRIEDVIAQRKAADPDASYVASLFQKGEDKIAEKLGEEAVETIVAALSKDKNALTEEAADLIFHLLVLLAEKGITLADVESELARREGLSGLAEKASRAQ